MWHFQFWSNCQSRLKWLFPHFLTIKGSTGPSVLISFFGGFVKSALLLPKNMLVTVYRPINLPHLPSLAVNSDTFSTGLYTLLYNSTVINWQLCLKVGVFACVWTTQMIVYLTSPLAVFFCGWTFCKAWGTQTRGDSMNHAGLFQVPPQACWGSAPL